VVVLDLELDPHEPENANNFITPWHPVKHFHYALTYF
jgi:hypothetical protein